MRCAADGWLLPLSLLADYFIRWIESIIYVSKESQLRSGMKIYFQEALTENDDVSKVDIVDLIPSVWIQ